MGQSNTSRPSTTTGGNSGTSTTDTSTPAVGTKKSKRTIINSQALQTQTALAEVTGMQSRLNMELGAGLDRANKQFFTGEDIRQTRASAAEARLNEAERGFQERATVGATGAETRATRVTEGEQARLGYVTQGEQNRLGYVTQGEQARLGYQTQGQEERLNIGTRGTEERKTQLQQQMENRYIAQRNRDWAKSSYRA